MKRNNKVLYEQIMRNVSREVKKALNENYVDNIASKIIKTIGNTFGNNKEFLNNVDTIMDTVKSYFINKVSNLPHTLDELIEALYKDFKAYGEFENLKTEHKFEFVKLKDGGEEYENYVDKCGIKNIIHLAKIKDYDMPEKIYEFKIEDVVDYFDGDFTETYLVLHDIFSHWFA